MLRKKLLFSLGPMVVLVMITAVAAVWLLQGVLTDLQHLGSSWDGPSELRGQYAHVVERLRWLVLGLSVVFLVVVNVVAVVLLRAGAMIVRPVDKLLAATRQLGDQRLDCRVNIAQNDEFDQLAGAFNEFAERLQANEKRKVETLGQVALAMNHELNNCIAIIELQMRLVKRQMNTPGLEKCLTQIEQSLRRITGTVQRLKNARRIVLTDYVPGVKMLDLERSSQDFERPERPEMAAHHP